MTRTSICTGWAFIAVVLFDLASLGGARSTTDFTSWLSQARAGHPGPSSFSQDVATRSAGPETDVDRNLRRHFAEPPQRYWPRPLSFWNNTQVTVETVKDQMRQARDRCRYGESGILPFGKEFSPAYLSDAYFTVYAAAPVQAKTLGLALSFYDEYGLPSGSAGSRNSSDTTPASSPSDGHG